MFAPQVTPPAPVDDAVKAGADQPPPQTTHLRELTDFKAALDEHAIVAITDARGRITYVNDKFCAISKWSRDELLGKDHRIINSGFHPKEFIRDLWDTIRAGKVWKGELKNRAKDGSYYWVDTTIVPFLGETGKPYQYIAIRAEITQRKLLEERNAEMLLDLEAANRELNEFAYIVSHDLKAPLRSVVSLASWLLSDYEDKLGTEGGKQLRLISSRVKRLSELIDGILTYSRAGRHTDQRLRVALSEIVKNTVELLSPPETIKIEIKQPLPTLVMEPFKVHQVFQNLLSNAVKFMDKPDGLISVSCAEEATSFHFQVSDNGPGIEAKYFDKIFQLFQTLAPRDEIEGTGVGLALVKKIIETHGGKIWVQSTIGEGTVFHFTLPRSLATHAVAVSTGAV